MRREWLAVGCFVLLVLMWTGTSRGQAPATTSADPPEGLWGWQFERNLPEGLSSRKPGAAGGADLLVWVPPGATRVRSVLLIPNNTDSIGFGACTSLRRVGVNHEMGVVYMRTFDTAIEWERKTPPDPNRLVALCNYIADETKMPEFRHVPWITFGKSSRGSFPFRAAWLFPERTIASIAYHAETPTWPVADFAKLNGQTILQCNANGETEWGGTWFNHVRPSLLNYRAQKGWLAHQVVARGVGHGDYPEETSGRNDPTPRLARPRVWDYLALFVDKALELRVSKDKYPTDGPVPLKQVDESSGYLIDPFAVEELFRVPRLPLREEGGVFVNNPGEKIAVTGFAALSPLKDFAPAEGVPVVKLGESKSPRQWLVSDVIKGTMRNDPMTAPGDWVKLMPKPGDEVTLDGRTLTFRPILPKQMGKNGGIALSSGKNALLAYTVIDIPQRRFVKVEAGFTAATRIQMVINGMPVKHKQVLELQPGKYPLLIALSMGVYWDRIEPTLGDVTDEEVAQAKQAQAEASRLAAEEAKLKEAGPRRPPVLIRPATEVPREQRARMFWVADRQQAEAWFKLHAVHEQKLDEGYIAGR